MNPGAHRGIGGPDLQPEAVLEVSSVKGLLHGEAGAQEADATHPSRPERLPRRFGDMQQGQAAGRRNGVGQTVHGVGTKHEVLCPSGGQAPGRGTQLLA